LNQPAAKPPNYPILQVASDPAAFYTWVRSCRKESLHCMPVDRRPLNQLVSVDVKEEIARILLNARDSGDPTMFDQDAPYPASWPEVTDKLLLRVLFGLNGPQSAAEAKERCKKLVFYFNDSTTFQNFFTAKLRKHCNKFKSDLADCSYSVRKWPKGQHFTHHMIVEAFTEGFASTETIKGKPGTSAPVPRCKNLYIIREFLREHKGKLLDEIVTILLDHFEALDIAVRTTRGISYDVVPWVTVRDNKRSRGVAQIDAEETPNAQVNQVSGGAAHQRPPKTAKPATNNPRCNNCGSKGHTCSERTCFLWGAPGAKGANGEWAEGTPSLKLVTEDWATFSKVRKPVFYSYPENAKKPRPSSA
jgi:hypothetical protein